MKFGIIAIAIIVGVGFFLFSPVKNVFKVEFAHEEEKPTLSFPTVKTITPTSQPKNSSPPSTPKATSTFVPPTGSFRGPVGKPYIKGPSGPPPNY